MPNRIIRLRTVLDRTGLSRSTLYRKIGEGAFPPRLGSACMALDGARPRWSAGSRTRPVGGFSPWQANDLGCRRFPLDNACYKTGEFSKSFALLPIIRIAIVDPLHAGDGVPKHAFAHVGTDARARHKGSRRAAKIMHRPVCDRRSGFLRHRLVERRFGFAQAVYRHLPATCEDEVAVLPSGQRLYDRKGKLRQLQRTGVGLLARFRGNGPDTLVAGWEDPPLFGGGCGKRVSS